MELELDLNYSFPGTCFETNLDNLLSCGYNKSIKQRDRKMWSAHFFDVSHSIELNWNVRNKPVISITSHKMSPRLSIQHRIFIDRYFIRICQRHNNDQSFKAIQTRKKERIYRSNEKANWMTRRDCYCDLHRKIYWLEQIWSNTE